VCVCVCVLGLWWIPSKPLCIWKQQELKNWKGRWPVICGVPGILDLVKMPYETEWCNWLPIYDHFFIEPPNPKTPPHENFAWKAHDVMLDLRDLKAHIPRDMIGSNSDTFPDPVITQSPHRNACFYARFLNPTTKVACKDLAKKTY